MTVNSAVNVMAGFVGLNLFQMGFTGFCPAKSLFRAMGMKGSNQSDSNCCS